MKRHLICLVALAAMASWLGCDAPTPSEKKGGTVAGQSLTNEQAAAASELLDKPAASKENAGRTKVALLLNWYPEAEHGGFYAAQVHGIYEKYGLEVDIRSGGKTTLVPQELTLGRIQFGVANADDVLIARSQDVPLVALMAPIQNGPRCIMVRKDSGITSFADLKNIKLQIDKSRPYVPFLKSKGFLNEGVEIVPFFGTVDQLVAGPGTATQGYNFSEPFMAREKGVEVNELMMSEIGYNPYCSLLVTTESYLGKNDDVCKRMTLASIEGWKKYLASPAQANEVILSKNKQGLQKNALDYGVEALKKLCFTSPAGDDSAVGTMSAERWKSLADTLASLKMIDASKARVESAYTTRHHAAP
jgi:NitT/TauT family transport system substrate-binding protein